MPSDAMTRRLDELRAALWAFLDHPDAHGDVFEVRQHWDPLMKRTYAAIDAIEADAAADPSLATELDAMTGGFRADAMSRGKERFAFPFSPFYPWGVAGYVDSLAERLRYRHLAQTHQGPCNCELVIEHRMLEQLDTKDFVRSGSSYFHGRYFDYQCPHCQRRWRREECSTEQVSGWAWRVLP